MKPNKMKNLLIKTSFLAVMVVPTVVWASPFAQVARPIEPTMPTPVSQTVVVPEVRTPEPKPVVPQRIEILADNRFVVLPEEAPMPGGTIAGHMFADESNTVTEGEMPAYLRPTPRGVEPTAARLAETVEGYQLEVQGQYDQIQLDPAMEPMPVQPLASTKNSEQNTVAKTEATKPAVTQPEPVAMAPEPSQKAQAKPPVKPKPKKAKPKDQTRTAAVKLTYELDGVVAQSKQEQEALAAFVNKLDGTLVKDILLLAQTAPQPLGEDRLLVHQRWRQILPVLAKAQVEARGVRVSEILLQGEEQFLQLEVTYQNK